MLWIFTNYSDTAFSLNDLALFADNELHNIKEYTEDQKKNKVLAMATVTINTTTQKPDNMQISWNLFL